jgi:hypothetical protein
MVEYGSGRWGSGSTYRTSLEAVLQALGHDPCRIDPDDGVVEPLHDGLATDTVSSLEDDHGRRRKVWQGQRSHHGESVTTRGSAKPEGRDAASPLSPGARQARPLPRPAVGAKVSSHRPFVLESWRCPPPDHRSPRLPTRFACGSLVACTPNPMAGRSGASSSSPATRRSATWARRSRSPSASTTRTCGRSSSAASRGTARMSMPGRRRRMMAGGLGQLTGCTSVTPPPARNSCSCSTTAMSGTSASGWSVPARRLRPTPSIRGWWPAVARPHPSTRRSRREWDEQAEDDEELLAQWEQAEAEAVEVLRQALPAPTLAPLPAGELQQACQHLRASLGRHDPAVETLRRAAGLDPPAAGR